METNHGKIELEKLKKSKEELSNKVEEYSQAHKKQIADETAAKAVRKAIKREKKEKEINTPVKKEVKKKRRILTEKTLIDIILTFYTIIFLKLNIKTHENAILKEQAYRAA